MLVILAISACVSVIATKALDKIKVKIAFKNNSTHRAQTCAKVNLVQIRSLYPEVRSK